MHKRLPGARIGIVAAAVALIAAGSAFAAGALHSGKVTKIAIASPAKQSDYGWNQQGYNGGQGRRRLVGRQVHRPSPNIGYDKTHRQPAAARARRRAVHHCPRERLRHRRHRRSRRQYKVPMMTYDVATNLTQGLVSYITTSSQQGAYLAGILAAQDDEDHKSGSSSRPPTPTGTR